MKKKHVKAHASMCKKQDMHDLRTEVLPSVRRNRIDRIASERQDGQDKGEMF